MRVSLSCQALFLGGVIGLIVGAGCAKPPAQRAPVPPAPVVVATAIKKTVPVQIRSFGTAKTMSTYSVRPRVSGELTDVHFNEGDDVKKGQKLFTIDPRPYETAVARAAATLAKDKAVLSGAQLDLDRVERATRTGVASGEDLDTARTAVASAKATVEADEAALHSAKLQLSFTTITSPIAGRTGSLLVTPGNLVSTTDTTPLVVVNQISPLDVAFALPEQLLPKVMAARLLGILPVVVTPRNGDPPVAGLLSFSDNTVDTATGTVMFKATFTNEDRKLWPGQFVDVVLTTGSRPDSVVLPMSAIQSGQQGTYVYLVTPEKTAQLRPVTVAFEESGQAVIADGLQGGETVVVEGQLRLAPGVKVDVKEEVRAEEPTNVGGKENPKPEAPVPPAAPGSPPTKRAAR